MKSCLLDLCQKMLPANEIMAPLAFTASEMIFVQYNSHILFVGLQCGFVQLSSPLLRNGENQEKKKRGKSTDMSMYDPLPLTSQSFLLVFKKFCFCPLLRPDFFTTQGLFFSFFSTFHYLNKE